MDVTVQSRRYTLEEYLDLEYHSDRRHFFCNGIVAPMTYTSDNHGLIVANLIREIGMQAKMTDYRVYPSDRMLYVPGCRLNYYPDVMVVQGEPQFHRHTAHMHATLNPCVIIEVSSDSTEELDRTEKWRCYRQIETLRQYIIISQKQIYIDLYNRIGDSEKWENSYLAEGASSLLVAGFPIGVSDIYWQVKFESPETNGPSTDR